MDEASRVEAGLGEKWLFIGTALALLAGLILSIISWLHVCSGACAESHNWRFFGWPFETLGLFFFISVNFLFWLSKGGERWREILTAVVGLFIAGAAGAELHFILVQKYQIKAWCPVCLSIATFVGIALLCYGIKIIRELYRSSKTNKRGEFMTSIWKGMASLSVFSFGFFLALLGTAKIDPLLAAEATLKESLFFGKADSPLEIYLFTDWACPACRALEPEIDKMAPLIMQNARWTFVDYAIHPQTFNYSPYNLSFMIRNKPEYLKLRDGLTEISVSTPAPSVSQIQKIAEDAKTRYEPLNFSDVALSQKYFSQLQSQFAVKETPSLVIVNRNSKKGKKLIGLSQITEQNVGKALASLKG